jgi:hypothetical protein
MLASRNPTGVALQAQPNKVKKFAEWFMSDLQLF